MDDLIACPLCGSKKTNRKFRSSVLPVHACRCGMVFLNPPLAPSELKRLYDKTYYRSWGIIEDFENVPGQMKKKTFSKRLQDLALASPGSKVLDVGCATGFFLEIAAEAGFDVYGVELSPFAASQAQKKLGSSRVFQGTLEEVGIPDATFDLVTLSDLLEHIPELDLFVEEVARILTPGGTIMIVTPNVKSLSARLMGRHWSHYKAEHLVYFSPLTLRKLLNRHGFDVITVRPADKFLNINYILHQFTIYRHPVLTPAIAALAAILPASLKEHDFRVRLGEMICLAKKS